MVMTNDLSDIYVAQGIKGARGEIKPRPEVAMRAVHRAGAEPDYLDPQLFSDKQNEKVELMRANGIINPVWTLQVCSMFEVPLFMECAYLEHESNKGQNVWHNDKTWMRGLEMAVIDERLQVPTEMTYLAYIAHRDRFGAQGIGPNGLTHPTFQARGDFYGGCWKPRANMAGAVSHFAEQLALGKTMDQIAHDYNPGSPTYAETDQQLRTKWKGLLNP